MHAYKMIFGGMGRVAELIWTTASQSGKFAAWLD
jgi:hypothetical protein